VKALRAAPGKIAAMRAKWLEKSPEIIAQVREEWAEQRPIVVEKLRTKLRGSAMAGVDSVMARVGRGSSRSSSAAAAEATV